MRSAPACGLALLSFVLAGLGCTSAPVAEPLPGGPAAPGAGSADPGSLLHSSAQCLARRLAPGAPFPAGDIPPTAMAQRQSGSVAIRYDVVDGVARNLVVVASNPPGLYDAAALQHAARYRDPARSTVAGCVMTIDIRF